MTQDPSAPQGDTKAASPMHYHWLPVLLLQPGMVTARPVVGFSGNMETMFVAVGASITPGIIEQMIVKGVECVAVLVDEAELTAPPDAKVSDYQSRLREIFGSTPNEACQPLLDALMAGKDVLC